MVKVKLVQGKRFHHNGWKINHTQTKEIPSDILESFPNFFETVEEKPKRTYKKKTVKKTFEPPVTEDELNRME